MKLPPPSTVSIRKTTTSVSTWRKTSGLYDMLGNVAEWTTAEYRQGVAADEQACATASSSWIDTEALPAEVECVIRGGSWLSGQKVTRLARRGSAHKERMSKHIGFRLIMSEQ